MVWRTNKNQIECMQLFSCPEFIVFDTETTGLHPEKGDLIIQLAAFRLQPKGNQLRILDYFNEYIKPPFPVPDKITEITGIKNSDLHDKPTENDVFEKIFNFFGESPVLCAYNTKFDVAMIQALYKRHGKNFSPKLEADVLEMVRDHVSVYSVPDFKQETITVHYGLDKNIDFHKADSDILATSRLLKVLHYEYLHSPVLNGWKKPWLGYIYFLSYKRETTGLYIYLNKDKRLFYSQYERGWIMKGVENVGSLYDMEYVQQEIINGLGIESMDEIQKLNLKAKKNKNKMNQLIDNWNSYRNFNRKAIS